MGYGYSSLLTTHLVTPSSISLHFNDHFYLHNVVSVVYATATWVAGLLAGWLDVIRRYCIKMAKPILKLFWTFWYSHHSSFF